MKTLGCQMNEYDSQKMRDLLEKEFAYSKTEIEADADILILNTCSIREKAEDKVYDQLGRWRKIKAKKPNMLIAVAGCVASQEGSNIIRRAPYVDMVIGPQTIHRLPDLIRQRHQGVQHQVDVSFPEIEKFDCLPEPRAEGVKAYVSIMEGCSKYCSYCIVPYTRGEEISRPFDDILLEVLKLVQLGVREVTLLGQNVNHYLGKMKDGQTADLALLIYYLSEIPDLARLRFTTSHPVEFNDNLIQAYADNPKLVNQLHLPVQSGSDRILSLMKRGHTALEYKSKIRKLKAIRPDMTVSTDIIVGFPGETDADFAQTMKLVEEMGFDHSFSFLFSPRPGTPASELPDTTPIEVKKERLKILQARINQNTAAISHAMLDTLQNVLVESVSSQDENELMGRTENNRVVHFPGHKRLIGQIMPVKIIESQIYALRGELQV